MLACTADVNAVFSVMGIHALAHMRKGMRQSRKQMKKRRIK
jgi:hypothetical protein